MKTLILASQSPRRFEILKNEKFFFVSFPVYVSEIPDKNLSLNDQIIDIARRKAKVCLDQYPNKLQDAVILSADTMVCIDNLALGKARDLEEATETLKKLSGRTHQVKTALYLIDRMTEKHVSHIETTDVYFKKLSDADIANYLATNEYTDKAGSYAIQGLGKILVDKIEGDYNNVVGLPIYALNQIFKNEKWNFQRVE
jgi:septum formation protein